MKNYAKSVLNMSDIRLNRSEVLHQYLPEGNLFRDTVTGLKFSSEGFVELPVSQFNKNTSRLAITLHFDHGVHTRTTSENVEVFRIGNGDSIQFKVEVEKVSDTSIRITQIRFELGERIAVRSDTFSVTEQVVLLVDSVHLEWNVDDVYSRPSWNFLKTNTIGRSTLELFNPYDAAVLTTEFRGMDFRIVSVEERLVPVAGQHSFIGIAGTSPTFYPLATYSKLDEDDLLLNTYFDEDDTLQVEVGEVIHDGEEALGSITLSEGQSLATTFDHHDNFSLRFISVRESFDSPWFSVTKGDSKTSLYLTEMFSVVLDGVEVGQLQPNSVHTVWLVFVTGRCFVYCNRELVTSFEVLGDGLLKFEAGAGIGRVTGLQAFANDVRQRNLICHESVTSNRPWWDTHCHLIGFEGFLYDVHNSMGSTEKSSLEYIGTSITGTNNSNSVWIDTPFDTYGELIGLHISYSLRGSSSVNFQVKFTLDGENFRLNIQNSTTQFIVLYDSSNKVVKSTTLRADSNNHVSSLSFTTIQVVGDRMYIASGDSVLEVPVKFRKYHSMSQTSLYRSSNSADDITVEGLVGYTAKGEHALKFPCVTVPSARNLYVPNGNTLLELSGNDLCELVSDEPFEVQLPSKWSLGYSKGNFHEVSLTAGHDIVLPFVPATTPEFTMQLQIWEDSLIEGGEPYDKNILIDFGTLKVRVNKGGVGSFCEVILGNHVVTLEPLGFKGWRELILESDGGSVNTYVDGYLAGEVPFSEELRLERFNFVAEGPGLQNMKLSALRILNSASAGDLLGIGYSAPYSLVLDDSEEVIESELTVLKADTIRPSSAREALLPAPVFDTQANESSAVLRSALESLGGAVEVHSGVQQYVVCGLSENANNVLEFHNIRAEALMVFSNFYPYLEPYFYIQGGYARSSALPSFVLDTLPVGGSLELSAEVAPGSSTYANGFLNFGISGNTTQHRRFGAFDLNVIWRKTGVSSYHMRVLRDGSQVIAKSFNSSGRVHTSIHVTGPVSVGNTEYYMGNRNVTIKRTEVRNIPLRKQNGHPLTGGEVLRARSTGLSQFGFDTESLPPTVSNLTLQADVVCRKRTSNDEYNVGIYLSGRESKSVSVKPSSIAASQVGEFTLVSEVYSEHLTVEQLESASATLEYIYINQ